LPCIPVLSAHSLDNPNVCDQSRLQRLNYYELNACEPIADSLGGRRQYTIHLRDANQQD